MYNWCKELGLKELEEFEIRGIPYHTYRINKNILEVSINDTEFKVSKDTRANQIDEYDIVKVRRR